MSCSNCWTCGGEGLEDGVGWACAGQEIASTKTSTATLQTMLDDTLLFMGLGIAENHPLQLRLAWDAVRGRTGPWCHWID
jgi:hypothetical protein